MFLNVSESSKNNRHVVAAVCMPLKCAWSMQWRKQGRNRSGAHCFPPGALEAPNFKLEFLNEIRTLFSCCSLISRAICTLFCTPSISLLLSPYSSIKTTCCYYAYTLIYIANQIPLKVLQHCCFIDI